MNNNQQSSVKAVAVTKIYDYDPDLSSRPIAPHLHAIPEQPETKLDKYLMRFEQILNMTFRSLMMLTCLSLAVLVFAQVIMRYFMESSFSGIEETSILLAVWVYFLGMGYATREREHIHGGIVSLVVKDPKNEITKGKVSTTLRWPRGIWSASMIVGFAMMIGYFLLEAINQYRDMFKTLKQKNQPQVSPSTYKIDSQEV